MSTVFITGATGYLGRALVRSLLTRGHRVLALVRPGSEARVPPGAEIVIGDALRPDTYASAIPRGSVFVQLIGVPHPSPSKAEAFQTIDRPAGLGAVRVAQSAAVSHFVYISVAQPAPVMKVYQAVRAEVEAAIRASGLDATILRPWYVIGPGHRWPLIFSPIYRLMALVPAMRASALRLGLVRFEQMTAALMAAVERPAAGVRVWGVEEIRRAC